MDGVWRVASVSELQQKDGHQRLSAAALTFSSVVDVVTVGFMVGVVCFSDHVFHTWSLYCLCIVASSHGMFSCLLLSRLVMDCWRRFSAHPVTRHRRAHLALELQANRCVGSAVLFTSVVLLPRAVRDDVLAMVESDGDDDAWTSNFLALYCTCSCALQLSFRVVTAKSLDVQLLRNSFAVSLVTLSSVCVIALAMFFQFPVLAVFATGMYGLTLLWPDEIRPRRKGWWRHVTQLTRAR